MSDSASIGLDCKFCDVPESWTNDIGAKDLCTVISHNAGGYSFYISAELFKDIVPCFPAFLLAADYLYKIPNIGTAEGWRCAPLPLQSFA
jgi:hypothetical protein